MFLQESWAAEVCLHPAYLCLSPTRVRGEVGQQMEHGIRGGSAELCVFESPALYGIVSDESSDD